MKKLALVLVAVFGLSVVALANEHEGTTPAKETTTMKKEKKHGKKHEKHEKTETKTTEEHK